MPGEAPVIVYRKRMSFNPPIIARITRLTMYLAYLTENSSSKIGSGDSPLSDDGGGPAFET
jgi:hypothetical protein